MTRREYHDLSKQLWEHMDCVYEEDVTIFNFNDMHNVVRAIYFSLKRKEKK